MNIIILGIFSAILWRYTPTNKVIYAYILVLALVLIMKLFSYKDVKISSNNMYLILFSVVSLVYLILISIGEISFVAKRYVFVYLLIIYLYLTFTRYGLDYAVKFYKHLTVILNIFSVLNLYQVIFKKPLLLKYMDLMEIGYNYRFGTSGYRTMAVFNHPIVSGLFFIIAFLCNMYILKKSPLKYGLQALLLLNIYTSQARSGWLAFALILAFIVIRDRRKIITGIVKPRLTYKGAIMGVILLTVGFLFMIFNFQDLYNSIIQRFGDSLSLNSTNGSNLQRTMTIALIWNYMFDSGGIQLFFGHGGGTVSDFMVKHPVLINGFTTTDNQYLSLFYEFGILGMMFFSTVFIYITIKYFSKKKRHWTIDLSFLCFLVIAFDLFFFEAWPVVLVMLAFLIAILTFNFKSIEE